MGRQGTHKGGGGVGEVDAKPAHQVAHRAVQGRPQRAIAAKLALFGQPLQPCGLIRRRVRVPIQQ